MSKKEMIEGALAPCLLRHRFLKPGTDIALIDIKSLDIDALAEQAIVIEARVTHYEGKRYAKGTWLYLIDIDEEFPISPEFLGTPGKAIAIILSLEEE